MQLYKGFDKDLKCRDFQFEVGKEYEEKEADICNCGFHACENPMDVFGYYAPADSRYCIVDLDANDQTEADSKRVGKRIKVKAEIGLPGIIKAGVEYIKERVDWKNAKESNTGDRSAATNTGDRSAATNTGDRSAATNTGDRSAAIVEGKESVAISVGIDGKAKGKVGCFLVLAEWEEVDETYHRKDVKAVLVDGEKIKPDIFYMLKDGNFVEAE